MAIELPNSGLVVHPNKNFLKNIIEEYSLKILILAARKEKHTRDKHHGIPERIV